MSVLIEVFTNLFAGRGGDKKNSNVDMEDIGLRWRGKYNFVMERQDRMM
jgi:hypothetical protein